MQVRTRQPEEVRFYRKLEQDGECWRWTAALNKAGYGVFAVAGGGTIGAHRWSYQHLRGEVPVGLQLDHLCRNPPCVNPWHLEPVTPAVNSARGKGSMTHCKRGHEFTESNTYRHGGRRYCRSCLSIHSTRWRNKKSTK